MMSLACVGKQMDAVVIRKGEDNADEVQLNTKCCRVSFGKEETVTKKKGGGGIEPTDES